VRIPCGDGGVAEADREHCLADPGRADQQHVGGVFDEAQGGQLGDQFRVGRGLGAVVEVGEGERRGQRREAGQADPAPLVDGVYFDREEAFQERLVAEPALAAWSNRPGSASAAAVIRRNARWARSFW
jgi:hypothetical protein